MIFTKNTALHSPYPYIHKLLMHTDTILQAYALIECLERDVLDERDPVYLYVINLCTELDRFCLLTPYDRVYVMTVNTDNTVTDLLTFKEFLFLLQEKKEKGFEDKDAETSHDQPSGKTHHTTG